MFKLNVPRLYYHSLRHGKRKELPRNVVREVFMDFMGKHYDDFHGLQEALLAYRTKGGHRFLLNQLAPLFIALIRAGCVG